MMLRTSVMMSRQVGGVACYRPQDRTVSRLGSLRPALWGTGVQGDISSLPGTATNPQRSEKEEEDGHTEPSRASSSTRFLNR
ncbi:hypothetical protein KOW79_014340 [Hemibagrus wyckioides]|uniref:Uncharacterized protein n=1 Tax=Hemibagrus wyckioides TaxID=337641 RepID=A0A9D3NJN5_9TELE|nr:hypothetical protein KOW79_014340 [Hemibagrus wyckioides]